MATLTGVLTTISTEYRFFRQPRKIGDIFENNGETFIVIGIEKFEVRFQSLKVWYTCQNLSKTDYLSMKKAYKEISQLEVYVNLKYDDERLKTRLYLGSLQFIQGQYYKLMEYTDIKLDSTDLVISFTARPIYPLDRKEAKAKLIDIRKKRLQLEVF